MVYLFAVVVVIVRVFVDFARVRELVYVGYSVVQFPHIHRLERNFIPLLYRLYVERGFRVITVYDKHAAKNRPDRRVREATLFAVSALGGSLAMLLTMLGIRHKTLHKRFMIGIPLIIAVQVAAVAALVYFRIISY